MEKGSISVNAKNMFPIIKKWLYSDKDIFLRELVSNGCDAITKHKKLAGVGEAPAFDGEYAITVSVDAEKGTLTVSDNGIGMSEDEVKRYINQVAFSGAEDFLAKYANQKDEGAQIIGHFGLGFYSAFMVGARVDIDTKSFVEAEPAVHWYCEGGEEYFMEPSERSEQGTSIVLTLMDDEKEFLELQRLREVLRKYCAFLPYPIYLVDAQKPDDELKPINDTHPLWLKNPGECSREDYIKFYQDLFMDFSDPLFYIHLNVDYPFNLKGILYFPKLKHEYESIEGQIKLYNNQVFVADNIKEVIPEYLMLLKGVIDCPDLPLNVSRSFLQNDGYVRKISQHIVKKVADKLEGLFNTERDEFEGYWKDVHPFIKYGCLRDESFYDRVKGILLFDTTDGEALLISEYLEKYEELSGKNVYYVSDEQAQAQQAALLKGLGRGVVKLTAGIDNAFISFMEMKNEWIKFLRVDAGLSDAIKRDGEQDDAQAAKIMDAFREGFGEGVPQLRAQAMEGDVAAVMELMEQDRRMREMMSMYGMKDLPGETSATLVLNTAHAAVRALPELSVNDKKLVARQVYDLAQIGHRKLEPAEMADFLSRSAELLSKVYGKGL